MDPIRKMLVLLSVVAVPAAGAAAHSYFGSNDNIADNLCFANGAATYQISAVSTPDYRVRFDKTAAEADLRMQLVDRPEIADFVLADDFGPSPGSACRSTVPVKTVKVDPESNKPDVTVAITPEDADYKVYVHSARFSHQHAAALLAVMWKVAQQRKLAEVR